MNAIYKFFGVILSFFSDITGGYYLFVLSFADSSSYDKEDMTIIKI